MDNKKLHKDKHEYSCKKIGKTMSVTETPLSRCLEEDQRDEAMTCLQDPIVITNQLLLKCNMQNGSFIPQQIISLTNLLKELKKQQQQNNADKMDAMKKKRKVIIKYYFVNFYSFCNIKCYVNYLALNICVL